MASLGCSNAGCGLPDDAPGLADAVEVIVDTMTQLETALATMDRKMSHLNNVISNALRDHSRRLKRIEAKLSFGQNASDKSEELVFPTEGSTAANTSPSSKKLVQKGTSNGASLSRQPDGTKCPSKTGIPDPYPGSKTGVPNLNVSAKSSDGEPAVLGSMITSDSLTLHRTNIQKSSVEVVCPTRTILKENGPQDNPPVEKNMLGTDFDEKVERPPPNPAQNSLLPTSSSSTMPVPIFPHRSSFLTQIPQTVVYQHPSIPSSSFGTYIAEINTRPTSVFLLPPTGTVGPFPFSMKGSFPSSSLKENTPEKLMNTETVLSSLSTNGYPGLISSRESSIMQDSSCQTVSETQLQEKESENIVVQVSSSYLQSLSLGKKLLKAAQEGRSKEVADLLAQGADVNFTFGSKWTALHRAAKRAHHEVINELLKKGADVSLRACHGFTALHMAAVSDTSGESVCLLINAGADLNIRNRSGRTPLHYAVESRNVAAVQALVLMGANVEIEDIQGTTPLDMAEKDPSIRPYLK